MSRRTLSFVAKSGTGKTTLLEKLIAELKRRGRKVGILKHDAHRFEIDYPGKDTHRLFSAGADAVAIASPEKIALIERCDGAPPLETLLARLFGETEIVLTEGFKRGPLPKIEVHRRERSDSLICRGEAHDPTLVAVVSDEPLELDVPVLPLDDVGAIADFVEAWFCA
jgi:molybdopterin-guanine dinucleotide biosynthesis protein MobB